MRFYIRDVLRTPVEQARGRGGEELVEDNFSASCRDFVFPSFPLSPWCGRAVAPYGHSSAGGNEVEPV